MALFNSEMIGKAIIQIERNNANEPHNYRLVLLIRSPHSKIDRQLSFPLSLSLYSRSNPVPTFEYRLAPLIASRLGLSTLTLIEAALPGLEMSFPSELIDPFLRKGANESGRAEASPLAW